MTALIPDPEQFLRDDPRQLVDPLQLTPQEGDQVEYVQRSVNKLAVAAGLAAAYLVYRGYMARRMREEVRKMGGDVAPGPLWMAASAVWNAFIPRWVSMTAPYLVVGYLEGIKEAKSGTVPTLYLEHIARGYAEDLGHHINDVSAEALISGFQAQVNRKVPPLLAARRTADAYGVTRRGMNTLVNVWLSEDPKKLTDQVLPSAKEERVKALVDKQHQLRARTIGDNEEWAAKTQAKQIVWMYGAQHGVLPATARRVWITAADERVCPICGPMNGKSAKIGDRFKLKDGQKVWTPPTHVNCRCDVALDLEPSEDLQDEITALLDAEQVTKAMGQDHYDRDKRGRFARDEQRQVRYKEAETNVDALLAQVDEALKVDLTPVKALSATPEKQKLLLTTLKAPAKLKLLSVPKPSETKTSIKTSLKRDLSVKNKLNLSNGLSAELFKPEKIRAEDIDTNEGHWEYMDEVLTTVLDPWQHHDIGDSVMLDEHTPFYEEHHTGQVFDPRRNVGKPRTMAEAIGDYWDNWAAGEMEEFRLNPPLYHDESTDHTWLVTEDAYEAMLGDLINGVKAIHQEVVDLDGLNEMEGEALSVTTGEMAKQFGMQSKMDNDAPMLLQTKHGMPGVTEKLSGHEWRNPGRWRVVNVREVYDPHETNYHHLGYTILEVEPSDLFGTDHDDDDEHDGIYTQIL